MPAASTLLLFAVVSFGFAALPGPGTLSVVARGIGSGTRAGLAAAAGCATASVIYATATAVGLAAVIASSQVAVHTLHYVGGAYLVYLGIRAWRDHEPLAVGGTGNGMRPWKAYRQGTFVELGNPKVALFYLAFFPQFVHPGHGPAALQLALLGLIYVIGTLITYSLYALASGAIGRWIARSPRVTRLQGRFTGGLFVALGAWILLSPVSASDARSAVPAR
jgi:threonine/homoserine/homoserine lactone efflux protein